MLPWPARSPYLSLIENVWDIIGQPLQHHPQPGLTVSVLTQAQQAWNSIPLSDIRHLVPKDLKSFSEYDRASLKEINNFLRNSINVILSDILSLTDSSKCVRDFEYVFDNLQSGIWALKMFDSYGKPESGVLNGNVKWLGEYFECLEIRAPPKPYEDVGGFQGKYCTLQIPLKLGNVSLPLSTAVCLPDSCDPSGSIFGLSQNINLTDHLPSYNEDFDSFFNGTTITCQSTSPRQLTTGAIVVICLISIFASLSVIGSLITVCEYYLKRNAEKEITCGAYDKISVNSDLDKLSNRGPNVLPDWLEKCKPFFNCFCMFTNGEKILNTTSTEGQLPCLHGIRFLSMSWVILCHGYMFGVGSIRNTADIANLFDSWTFQVVLNGFYSVDAFFVLSGFLVAYLFFQQAAKTDGKIPWLYFYIHRFIRLTPVYMMVMAFYTTLMSHLGSGPLWSIKDTDPNCQASWWWNILYINNFQTSADQTDVPINGLVKSTNSYWTSQQDSGK
ncbi:nose resistant to fluoxetine protein 6 [Trichonephila clavipes]|nr:nose resistant to fluoxetine protein 6 [Trichonephila clavipes]